jgi:hypothetical protein
MLDGLVAVLEHEGAGIARVWGTSFGGMAAQALVRRAPNLVATAYVPSRCHRGWEYGHRFSSGFGSVSRRHMPSAVATLV